MTKIEKLVETVKRALDAYHSYDTEVTTVKQATALKDEAKTSFATLVSEVKSRVCKAFHDIVAKYPELKAQNEIVNLIPGFPHKAIFAESEEEFNDATNSFFDELIDTPIGYIICRISADGTLVISEEHGIYIYVPMEFLADDFDPTKSNIIRETLDTINLTQEWIMTFGGELPSKGEIKRVMTILKKYPECVKELKESRWS